MKELEKFTDEEIFAEFNRRFVDISKAADIMGYEHNGAVGQLVYRGHLKAYVLGPRFNMYSRSAVKLRAKNRPAVES